MGIELALIQFPVRYDEAMNTVLTQELQRFNNLTDLIKGMLKEVQRAIKGLVVMSGELETMGNSMVTGKVPGAWAKAAYPSRKPLGSWVLDLIARLKFLQDWFDALVPPNIFWISGFYFIQAFITGTLQNYARKYQLPIDTVAFDFPYYDRTRNGRLLPKKYRMDPSATGCSSRARAGTWRSTSSRNRGLGNCTRLVLCSICSPRSRATLRRSLGGPSSTRARLQVPHTCTRYRSTGKAPERASSAPRAIRRTSSCSSACPWPRSTRSSTGSSAAWRCCRSWTTNNII